MILVAQNDDAGRRLDRILRKALPDFPLSALHRLLRKGKVLINGKSAEGKDRIPAGTVIEIPVYKTERQLNEGRAANRKRRNKTKLDVLWEGAGLLILNKPAGLAAHAHDVSNQADTLEKQVLFYLAGTLPASLSFRPGPLHRLDKPTSGIIVFALNLDAARRFSALLQEGSIRKRYLAVVEGDLRQSEIWEDELFRDQEKRKTFASGMAPPTLAKDAGHAEPPGLSKMLKGRRALTRVTPLARTKLDGTAYTYARLEIETGRTHQIRAQAARRSHPLAGDRKYGGKPLPAAHPGCRFFLHAAELELPKSETILPGIPRIIRAPLPETFEQIVKKLFG